MRKIIYQCDQCEKILSDGVKIALPHLSIDFNNNSGWVKCEKDSHYWQHFKKVSGIKQFCDGKCLMKYFNDLKPTKK